MGNDVTRAKFPGSTRYNLDEARRESLGDFPLKDHIPSEDMAEAGFWYTGRADKVQCCVCNVCLGNWKEHKDPWNEHTKYAPDCPLVRHRRELDNNQGIKLGNYLLSEEVGRGTFGIVRLAKKDQADFYAIKRLTVGNRIKLEKKLRDISSLPFHVNVMHIHEALFHSQKQVVYITMDYYKPFSLNDIMNEISLKNTAKMTCMQDIMQGLYFLHQHEVVHGDLRPFNVMIAVRPPSICCKLSDYGIYSLENTGVEHIERNELQNFYQSPEVQNGGRRTKQGDIFSLAQLFFVIITERKKKTDERDILVPAINTQEGAYTVNALVQQDILGGILEEELKHFEMISPLMVQMLQKDPSDRPDMERVRGSLLITAATYCDEQTE